MAKLSYFGYLRRIDASNVIVMRSFKLLFKMCERSKCENAIEGSSGCTSIVVL